MIRRREESRDLVPAAGNCFMSIVTWLFKFSESLISKSNAYGYYILIELFICYTLHINALVSGNRGTWGHFSYG
jgi:hypothetical protein